MKVRCIVGVIAVAMTAFGCSPQAGNANKPQSTAARAGRVDAARLAQADLEPDQWFTPGRDAMGSYYSPLAAINDSNVNRLGFAWDYRLGTSRGLEATPVVVDGVMYAVGNWGRVYALDATTGRELWTYDPLPDGQWWGRYACCDVVNRGLAVWGGRVYVGSTDAYLHAIDATSGRRVWKVDTLTDRGPKAFHYYITGAPLLAGDEIVIGNGGSDFTGARGQLSAFDARTGKLRWRFYTVPHDPRSGPQEQSHLDVAVNTWPPDYDWSQGGGGSAWDGLAYDAEMRLIYVGTANGIPYRIDLQAQGANDRLYTNAILAIDADSGQLRWYYQEVPSDGWDYDATQKMILASIPIGGQSRRVLLHAGKDGYFYVLDRRTGELISATPFVYCTWTKGIDPKTHRPIPSVSADWESAPKIIYPSPMGGHNWQPMSYNPITRLVYIPAIDAPMVYINTERRRAGLTEGSFQLTVIAPEDYDPKALENLFGPLPTLDALDRASVRPAKSRGLLRALDPATGQIRWEQPGASVWDGGILSTGGNLVLRGDVVGHLLMYRANDGKLLKDLDVGTSIMAAPMTYRVNGVQYVSVMAGYGGGVLYLPFPPNSAAHKYGNAGRIITFRLDGGAVTKPEPVREAELPEPPPQQASSEQIAAGELLYNRYCARCHVFGRGMLPDLRRMSAATHHLFDEIVLKGAYEAKGMARWNDVLSREDVTNIHAYLIDQAWKGVSNGASGSGRKRSVATEEMRKAEARCRNRPSMTWRPCAHEDGS